MPYFLTSDLTKRIIKYSIGSVSEFALSHEAELELKACGLTHIESASLTAVTFTAATVLRRADELLQNEGKTVL